MLPAHTIDVRVLQDVCSIQCGNYGLPTAQHGSGEEFVRCEPLLDLIPDEIGTLERGGAVDYELAPAETRTPKRGRCSSTPTGRFGVRKEFAAVTAQTRPAGVRFPEFPAGSHPRHLRHSREGVPLPAAISAAARAFSLPLVAIRSISGKEVIDGGIAGDPAEAHGASNSMPAAGVIDQDVRIWAAGVSV